MERFAAGQTLLFLKSLPVGAMLELWYEGFRILRLWRAPGRVQLAIQDLLYCILSGGVVFAFFLEENAGSIRTFCLFGMLLGWVLSYMTVGTLVLRWAPPVLQGIRRGMHFLWRFTFAPLGWIFRKLWKISLDFRQIIKKCLSFSQFHLQRK